MDEIMVSHCIASEFLRADRFWDFFIARAETLFQRVEGETGKKITRDPESFGAGVMAEIYDERPTGWDVEKLLDAAAS